MLPRDEGEVARTIGDFFVAVEGGEAIGCGALAFYGHDLAEVRSLAARTDRQARGVGTALVRALLAEADAYEIPSVICFTYVPDFFARFGFRVVRAEDLPRKAWTDCVKCPKRNFCDEVAMERALPEETAAGGSSDL
jgi:amino-acid N-acetyltransferase